MTTPLPLPASPRAYRILLRCFSRATRDGAGEEMARQFAEEHARVAGRPVARLRLWTRAAIDAGWHGLLDRLGIDQAVTERHAFRSVITMADPNSRGAGPRAVRFLRDALTCDVRLGIRRLRATPAFTLFAMATLALGIGATTAAYSIVRAALGPPPGVTTLDRLVTVNHHPTMPGPLSALAYGDYLVLRARETVFQDVAAWTRFRPSYLANGQGETAFSEIVSGEYFDVLGVRPKVGRLIQPADDSPTAAPVAVISWRTWQRLYDGDPRAIGQSVKVNGASFEIVGVASREFVGLHNGGLVPSALWIPMATAAQVRASVERVQVRARLAPEATLEEARAQVSTIAEQLEEEQPLTANLPPGAGAPGMTDRPWTVRRSVDISVNEAADRIAKKLAATLMALVGVVLLVACATLANLMLARGVGRRHELSVRLALGASRWRLIRQIGTENVLVSMLGGMAGIGVARILLVMLGTELPLDARMSFRAEPRLDMFALALSAAATLLVMLVAGLAPAWHSTRVDVRSALASDGSHTAVPRWRGRRLLVTGQVAVSMLLISISALFLTELRAAGRVETGIDLDRIAAVQVDFASQEYEPARIRQIVDAVLRQAALRPEVESTAASSGLPVGAATAFARIGLDRPSRIANLLAATPDIFRTMGVSIARGRGFASSDTANSEPVAVIDVRTAVILFGRENVVGQQLVMQRRRSQGDAVDHPIVQRTIVGVTAALLAGVREVDDAVYVPAVYVPLDQHHEGNLTVIARTSGDPAMLVEPLRQALRAVEPEAAIAQAGVGAAIAGMTHPYLAVFSGISSSLGTFALVLAMAGLAGVLSHLVAGRRRELAVRLALGATGGEVLRLVLRDGLHLVSSGIALGLALGFVGVTWLGPTLGREGLLPVLDLWVIAAVPVAMMAAGVIASYLPARQAAVTHPSAALREG